GSSRLRGRRPGQPERCPPERCPHSFGHAARRRHHPHRGRRVPLPGGHVTTEPVAAIELVRSDRSRGFFVKFWGTRGSIPAPGFSTRRYGGNTSCVELRIDGKLFICDAGSGLRDLGSALLKERGGEEITAHMFFSHFHWDHIQGFPFFAPV